MHAQSRSTHSSANIRSSILIAKHASKNIVLSFKYGSVCVAVRVCIRRSTVVLCNFSILASLQDVCVCVCRVFVVKIGFFIFLLRFTQLKKYFVVPRATSCCGCCYSFVIRIPRSRLMHCSKNSEKRRLFCRNHAHQRRSRCVGRGRDFPLRSERRVGVDYFLERQMHAIFFCFFVSIMPPTRRKNKE